MVKGITGKIIAYFSPCKSIIIKCVIKHVFCTFSSFYTYNNLKLYKNLLIKFMK